MTCYIDECRNPATFILESYPDDVLLCDEHRSLHGEIQPWERDVSPRAVGVQRQGPTTP